MSDHSSYDYGRKNMLNSFKNLDRLKQLRLPSLEYRKKKLRYDLHPQNICATYLS